MVIHLIDMFWIVVLLMTSIGLGQCNLTNIFLMGLIPLEGQWDGGFSTQIGANVALEEINNRNDVLPGYRLNILWNNTKCDPGIGVDIMFRSLYSPPTKLMIFGAGCSSVSEATARVSHHRNLVQMTWGSVSPDLSDKTKYPRFFRGFSPEKKLNQPRIDLFKALGWKKIAMIHQPLQLFSEPINELVKRLSENNMTIIRSEVITGHPRQQIKNLMDYGARIIVGLFYEPLTRAVMCEAYKLGFYGPRIVWLLVDFLDSSWLEIRPSENLTCTSQQMRLAADGYFTISRQTYSRTPVVTVGGLDVSEVLQAFISRVNDTLPYAFNLTTPLAYDAIWCIALALNATQTRLSMTGNRTLKDFTYDDKEMSNLIVEEMKNTSFTGIRGKLYFDENYDQIAPMVVLRNQDGQMLLVAHYDESLEESKRIKWSSSVPVKWKDGVIPTDSMAIVRTTEKLSFSLYIAMCCFAGVGICLSISFLTFNIYNRHKRIVKMSSPRLNNVTLIGCLILYVVPFLEDFILQNRAVLCKAKIILVVIGFSLAFGALFAKTWRVYTAFTTITAKRKSISDTQLLFAVGCLVGVNVAVVSTWIAVDPIQVVVTQLEPKIDVVEDIQLIESVPSCVSDKESYFTGTLIAIQAVILLLGAFLAFETRKVKVEGLNDSKMIAMCIYHVFVLSVLGMTITLVLRFNFDLWYGLTSVIIIIGTTVTQSLIVVPKMMCLRSNKVENSRDTTLSSSEGTRSTAHTVIAQRLITMETVLMQKNRLIQELETKINIMTKRNGTNTPPME